jgi:hypothetical protein
MHREKLGDLTVPKVAFLLALPPPPSPTGSEYGTSPPPFPIHTGLCTEQLRNNSDMESALDRPPVHKKNISFMVLIMQ